jgi:hypothetical protein
MAIKIRITGRVAKPVAICDQCHQLIEDAHQGLYLWDLEECEGDMMPLYTVHKGNCERQFDQGRQMAWEALDSLPVFLGMNMNMDWKKTLTRLETFHNAV